MKKYISILALVLFLQSCSSGMDGIYSSNGFAGMGSYSFRFEKSGKVYISAMGVKTEGKYEKNGNQIKIEGNGGNMILTITDANTIEGPGGTTLHKQ